MYTRARAHIIFQTLDAINWHFCLVGEWEGISFSWPKYERNIHSEQKRHIKTHRDNQFAIY